MRTCLIKEIHFSADRPENVRRESGGGAGPLGILVTSSQHKSNRAQQTPWGTFTPMMCGNWPV